MNRTDLAVGLIFLLLGICLLVSSFGFPPGMGPLPGPGFYPGIVGAAIMLLAASLVAGSLRSAGVGSFAVENRRAIAVTAGLLALYIALWGVIPFAIRTVLFVVVFLRLLGQRWKPAIAVSLVLTAVVLAAFQYGLRVDFD